MLSVQKVANNIAYASRSFMQSAYVAQVRNLDPINQKLPSDRIVPDIIPEKNVSIDDPASSKWSNRNSESETIALDAMSRSNVRHPDPNNIVTRMSAEPSREELVDASDRFPKISTNSSDISSSERLRGGQSQIGEVPSQEEWNASSDSKSTAKEYMSDIKDKASDIKEKASDIKENVKANVREKASDYMEDLSEQASAAKQKQDEWMRKSSDSYENLKQNAKEKASDTMEKIKEMPHKIKEKVKDFTGMRKN